MNTECRFKQNLTTTSRDLPLVSVVMPAFNAEAYIAHSLASVCEQSFDEWELVVVDDGSSDATAEIVAQACARDPRIRLFRQQNRGVSAARNSGIRAARGKYVGFLDSDDLWRRDFLSLMTDALWGQPGAGLVYSNFCRFEDGSGLRKENPWKNFFQTGNRYHDMLIHVDMHINAVLVDKKILDDRGLFDEALARAEDCDLLLRLMNRTLAVHLPQELLFYRLRTRSLSADYCGAMQDEKKVLMRHLVSKDVPVRVRRLAWSSFAFKRAVTSGFAGGRWIEAMFWYAKAVLTAPTNWNNYLLPFRKMLLSLRRSITYCVLPGSLPPSLRISLVVATVGRLDPLRTLLESLIGQRHKNFELIVADQNAPGFLDPLLREYQGRLSIRHCHLDSRGVSAARNAVLDLVSGDIVAFPDDDCFYDSRTLENVANIFSIIPDCGVLLGNFLCPYKATAKTTDDEMRYFKLGHENRYGVFSRAGTIVQFFRREAVADVGHFDEYLGPGSGTPFTCGEDTDYVLRAMKTGHRVMRSADARVYHEHVDFSAPGLADKAYGYGRGRGYLLQKHAYGNWFKLFNCFYPLLMISIEGWPALKYRWNMFRGRFDQLFRI
jgi:glycosyltransferase involved in cell wall biosynthesis